MLKLLALIGDSYFLLYKLVIYVCNRSFYSVVPA